MSTSTQTSQDAQWQRVRTAITERWPHINRDALADCENTSADLEKFVKAHVDTTVAEAKSVISEFAPHESAIDRGMHAASDGMHQASESARFAYMRADECIAERPTESVMASFVAGIFIGATVTALWMRSTPQPNVWDRVRSNRWT